MPREDSEHPLWFGGPTNQARSEGRKKAKGNRIHFVFEEKQEQAFCSGGVTMCSRVMQTTKHCLVSTLALELLNVEVELLALDDDSVSNTRLSRARCNASCAL
jgi:hypothetical protein